MAQFLSYILLDISWDCRRVVDFGRTCNRETVPPSQNIPHRDTSVTRTKSTTVSPSQKHSLWYVCHKNEKYNSIAFTKTFLVIRLSQERKVQQYRLHKNIPCDTSVTRTKSTTVPPSQKHSLWYVCHKNEQKDTGGERSVGKSWLIVFFYHILVNLHYFLFILPIFKSFFLLVRM